MPDCEFAKGLCAGVSTTAGCSDESQGADNCLSVPVLQSWNENIKPCLSKKKKKNCVADYGQIKTELSVATLSIFNLSL